MLSKTSKSHSINAFNKYNTWSPPVGIHPLRQFSCFKFLNIYQCLILMLKADLKNSSEATKLTSNELMLSQDQGSHHTQFMKL